MKKLLLSGFVFATMSSAALAAEPLTEQQMDAVTAGVVFQGPFLVTTSSGSFNSTTGLNVNFATETFYIIGNGGGNG